MCGIVGFLDRRGGFARAEADATLTAMSDRLAHRGPDARGAWLDETSGIALGHRRLSIIDLSEAGAQPMTGRSGRFVIVFNGEIYNFLELRRELESRGIAFRGHSDTEVLLEAIGQFGLERVLPRLNGMFALALWDRETRQLTLARDRAGKKPLYYGLLGQRIVFASELKALRAMTPAPGALDPLAIEHYLRHGWIAAPRSIFKDIRQLPPASLVTLDIASDPLLAVPTTWWSALEVALEGEALPFAGSLDEATTRLDDILGRAVEQRMISDVPLGAMLSGGIDSSIVVALMQQRSTQPVRTFTIGFDEPGFNEAGHAAAIAAHLGTRHETEVVDPSTTLGLVPELPSIYDEPYADVSAIPTVILARMTARHVKVALTGDGGDETFAGYKRYGRLRDTWTRLERIPLAGRRMTAAMAHKAGDLGWRALGRPSRPLGKLAKRALLWDAASPAQLVRQDLARLADPASLMRAPPSGDAGNDLPPRMPADPLLAMQWSDYVSYLPGDVLVKIDRATMASSIEARAPLLDPAVLAFAFSLPPSLRRNARGGKVVLHELLARYLPRELFERPKQGFSVPVGRWLKGPLHDWAHETLSPARLDRSGVLVPERVAMLWQQHQSGWRNHENLLWALLSLEGWLAAWHRDD